MTRKHHYPKANRVPRLNGERNMPTSTNAFVFSDDFNDWIKSPYIRNKERERNAKKHA